MVVEESAAMTGLGFSSARAQQVKTTIPAAAKAIVDLFVPIVFPCDCIIRALTFDRFLSEASDLHNEEVAAFPAAEASPRDRDIASPNHFIVNLRPFPMRWMVLWISSEIGAPSAAAILNLMRI